MDDIYRSWLVEKISWTSDKLKIAMKQNNAVFCIVYQTGLDILLEALKKYNEINENEKK